MTASHGHREPPPGVAGAAPELLPRASPPARRPQHHLFFGFGHIFRVSCRISRTAGSNRASVASSIAPSPGARSVLLDDEVDAAVRVRAAAAGHDEALPAVNEGDQLLGLPGEPRASASANAAPGCRC